MSSVRSATVATGTLSVPPSWPVWAATAGGARALERSDVGHLGAGARADLVILDAPTRTHLAYRPGVPLVHEVYRGGVPLR